MNDAQLISRLAGTDAYAAEAPLPDEIWTPAAALHEIERRTAMQTQAKATQTPPAPEPPTKKRWLVPALAGAAAVVVAIVVAVAFLSGSDEPEVTNQAPLTPLEVGEAMNQAAITGNLEAARNLFADDATFTTTASEAPAGAVEDMPLAEPIDFPDPDMVDWDRDGDITRFDTRLGFMKEAYAGGVTRFYSCSQSDSTTVVCDTPYEGFAFRSDDPFALTDTFTVIEGKITQQGFTFSGGDPRSPSLRIEYHEWVRANRPEMNIDDALFAAFGDLLITPDTVETHRQLIADWRTRR